MSACLCEGAGTELFKFLLPSSSYFIIFISMPAEKQAGWKDRHAVNFSLPNCDVMYVIKGNNPSKGQLWHSLWHIVLATCSNNTTVVSTSGGCCNEIHWVFCLCGSIDASWRYFMAGLLISNIRCAPPKKDRSVICDVTTYVSVMQWSCQLKKKKKKLW